MTNTENIEATAWHHACGKQVVGDDSTRYGMRCVECGPVRKGEVTTAAMINYRLILSRRGDHSHSGFPGGVTAEEWAAQNGAAS